MIKYPVDFDDELKTRKRQHLTQITIKVQLFWRFRQLKKGIFY